MSIKFENNAIFILINQKEKIKDKNSNLKTKKINNIIAKLCYLFF